MTTPILFTAIGVVAFIVLVLLVSYVKCPPNQAYIISGLGKKPKVLIGKSGFRIPFLQRLDRISLELISIDVKTSSFVPTADFINIKVDSVVNVKVSDTPELIEQAQQHFLNMNTDDIATIAREVLEGNLREIVGTMSLPDMVTNRKAFADKVQENAVDDLKRMGLVITSFNVQNFYDENNVIENLGVDNVVKISKQANIARAEAERDIAVAKAAAEKEANDARIESETAIATKNNEYALKKAALDTKENSAKAVADAAYSIQEQEQRKSVEIATAEANLARQEKEILLKQKEVEIAEQKLSAEVEKKADAEKYAAQAKADADLYARQKEAEAKAFELQKAAEAEAFQKQKAAEAEKVAMEAEAAGKKALAEAIQAQGEAEANAIQAKLLAEAEGIEKRADALAKMNETGKLQMQLDVLGKLFDNLPTIAGEISKPLQSIDSITMYGDGNVEKLAKELTTTTDAMSKGLLGSLGVDLKSLVGSVLGGMSQTTTEATE